MSVLTKARRTKEFKTTVTVKPTPEEPTQVFEIPKRAVSEVVGVLKKLGHRVTREDTIPADEVFQHFDKKYGRAGAILRGARAKEGLTQEELARKTGIEQADLSKMETGRLTIGRDRAKRLGEALKIDYRIFL